MRGEEVPVAQQDGVGLGRTRQSAAKRGEKRVAGNDRKLRWKVNATDRDDALSHEDLA